MKSILFNEGEMSTGEKHRKMDKIRKTNSSNPPFSTWLKNRNHKVRLSINRKFYLFEEGLIIRWLCFHIHMSSAKIQRKKQKDKKYNAP